MARPPRYHVYTKDGGQTMHSGNDLEELISRIKHLAIVLNQDYEIRGINEVVWENEKSAK